MYRPLPDFLAVHPSSIDGVGIFAIADIPAGTYIGLTHVLWFGEPNNLLRTPLGGFINHSDTPNCKLKGKVMKHLYATSDISIGDELTITYSLYEV
jgi:SET domain-containing protein